MTINITCETDLLSFIDYETETSRPGCCGCRGCNHDSDDGCGDSYCRCSVIEHFKFNNALDAQESSRLIHEFSDSSREEKYIETMWLKNKFKNCDGEDLFDGRSCGGYYGDEVEGIYANDYLVDEINKFNSLSIVEKFHAALTAEYGRVLDVLENVTDFQFQVVNVETVYADDAGQKSTKNDVVDKYGLYQSYNKAQKIFKNHGEDSLYDFLAPLCVSKTKTGKNKETSYRVIDGHHRFKAHGIAWPKAKKMCIFVAK